MRHSHVSHPDSPPAPPLVTAVASPIEPRNMARPPGRAHHTVSHHAAGRSLLVFGGYSSTGGAGFMNDLWVFNLDRMEWWQPDVGGEWGWPLWLAIVCCVCDVRRRIPPPP